MELPIVVFAFSVVLSMGLGYGLGHRTSIVEEKSAVPIFEVVVEISSNTPKYRYYDGIEWVMDKEIALKIYGDRVVTDAMHSPAGEMHAGAMFNPMVYEILRGSDIGPAWVKCYEVDNLYLRDIRKQEECEPVLSPEAVEEIAKNGTLLKEIEKRKSEINGYLKKQDEKFGKE